MHPCGDGGIRECGGPSHAGTTGQNGYVVTIDDVRAVLAGLPRSSEVLVRDRVKFRVGQIVYVAFSQDETEIGFAFPKEERAALVAARPDVFFLPRVGAALPLGGGVARGAQRRRDA